MTDFTNPALELPLVNTGRFHYDWNKKEISWKENPVLPGLPTVARFYGWGMDFEDSDKGPGNFTAALLWFEEEKRIVPAHPNLIRFQSLPPKEFLFPVVNE